MECLEVNISICVLFTFYFWTRFHRDLNSDCRRDSARFMGLTDKRLGLCHDPFTSHRDSFASLIGSPAVFISDCRIPDSRVPGKLHTKVPLKRFGGQSGKWWRWHGHKHWQRHNDKSWRWQGHKQKGTETERQIMALAWTQTLTETQRQIMALAWTQTER